MQWGWGWRKVGRTTMKALFPLAIAVALAGLSACYTPRDVRPAAVEEAKSIVVKDLPALASTITQQQPGRAGMVRLLKQYLAQHPEVYGMAFAPGPPPAGKTPKPAIYVYRHGRGFATRELALPNYNYLRMEWYWKPIHRMEACWSEPYFDVEGGDVWMQTYSIPLLSGDGSVYGVLTNDVPVHKPRNG